MGEGGDQNSTTGTALTVTLGVTHIAQRTGRLSGVQSSFEADTAS